MFSFFNELFTSIFQSLSISTSIGYAFAVVFLGLFMLAIREVGSWLLKTNQLLSEILELRDQVRDLERKLDKSMDQDTPKNLEAVDFKMTPSKDQDQFPLS